MSKRQDSAITPAAERKRAVIYTRKSTDKGLEQDFNSLDAQREACERYIQCQAHLGWQLVPEHYDDGGFTGANIDRPAFAQLLEDIERGKIDVVVVYKVDRLSRSLLDFAKVMERFNAAGTSFVSVTQNFSTADAMGRLTLNMLMSFAEYEREMIAERTRDKIAASRRRGMWTGGPVPLGYEVREKKLVVLEDEARLVRKIFSLYLQHESALAVARHLNRAHQTTKQHTSQNGRLRGAQEWSKDAVLRVLRNPVYAGLIPHRKDVYPGEHEAIVDRATFETVAGMLARHGACGRRNARNPAYSLRGVLHCAACGHAMTPASTRKGSGRQYRYYRCVKRDKLGKATCQGRPLPAGAIEDFVVSRIREATSDGKLAQDVAARVEQRVADSRAGLLEERKKLPAKIAGLSAEARRLLDTMGSVNETGRRLVEQRLEQVSHALEVTEARLAEVERSLAALDDSEIQAQWVTATLQSFDAVWDAMTPENRARLVRAVVRRVEVDEANGNVTVVLNDLVTDGRRDSGAEVGAMSCA